MSRPVLLVATGNPGKRREFADLLQPLRVDLRDLRDYPGAPAVVEDAPDYAGNARHKALALARFAGVATLADDSGLEVDALAGAPGVRSARFASESASDEENVTLLLERLRGVPDERRTARFRCVIVVVTADGRELISEGACEGRITHAQRGAGGFGYDPVFYHPPSKATFAELPAVTKQQVSHRAVACSKLVPELLVLLRGWK